MRLRGPARASLSTLSFLQKLACPSFYFYLLSPPVPSPDVQRASDTRQLASFQLGAVLSSALWPTPVCPGHWPFPWAAQHPCEDTGNPPPRQLRALGQGLALNPKVLGSLPHTNPHSILKTTSPFCHGVFLQVQASRRDTARPVPWGCVP